MILKNRIRSQHCNSTLIKILTKVNQFLSQEPRRYLTKSQMRTLNYRTKNQKPNTMKKLAKGTKIIIRSRVNPAILELILTINRDNLTLIILKSSSRKNISLKNQRKRENNLTNKQKRCKSSLLNSSLNTLIVSIKPNRRQIKKYRKIEKKKTLRKRKDSICKRKDNNRGEKEFKSKLTERGILFLDSSFFLWPFCLDQKFQDS